MAETDVRPAEFDDAETTQFDAAAILSALDHPPVARRKPQPRRRRPGPRQPRISLHGVGFDAVTEEQAVSAVRQALGRGTGGRIVTPNVDIMRLARRDAEVRGYLADAALVVADGMPLVWASRIAGTPLPQRVPGSGLILSLSRALAVDRRSVYVLGGQPIEENHLDGAGRAARTLAGRFPGLRVTGYVCPPYGFERDPAQLDRVRSDVLRARPDLVFVGLGFPKQERVISLLRPLLPRSWFLGCGAAVNFVAGDLRRAPQWMQRSGMEWLHRMSSEPGRLAGRYLRHDAPYALRLLGSAVAHRSVARPGSAGRSHEVTVLRDFPHRP